MRICLGMSVYLSLCLNMTWDFQRWPELSVNVEDFINCQDLSRHFRIGQDISVNVFISSEMSGAGRRGQEMSKCVRIS